MKEQISEESRMILARVKKLMKHAESAKQLGSLEEAEAFSAKVTELLEKYNLSINQIDLDEDEDKFAKWMYSEEVSFRDNQSGQRWRLNLIETLSKHNFCDFTYKSYNKTFQVFGRMENVDTTVWTYNYLSTGLLRLAQRSYNEDKAAYGENRYAFLKDWLIGAVAGVSYRLQEQRRNSESCEQINTLIVFNDKALEKFLEITNPNVKTVKCRSINVGAAYHEGFEAGKNYNINAPLASIKDRVKLN